MFISFHPKKSDEAYFFSKGFITKKATIYTLKDIILNYIYSPIIFKDGIRKKENFISADLLVKT